MRFKLLPSVFIRQCGSYFCVVCTHRHSGCYPGPGLETFNIIRDGELYSGRALPSAYPRIEDLNAYPQ